MLMVDKKLKYYEGIGGRKVSTARVRIYLGETISVINGKAGKEFFSDTQLLKNSMKPLEILKLGKKFGVSVIVSGGGVTGQSEAIRLGLSRALIKYNPTFRPELKKAGFLTRDSRRVERKKFFLIKARKAPQYSKR